MGESLSVHRPQAFFLQRTELDSSVHADCDGGVMHGGTVKPSWTNSLDRGFREVEVRHDLPQHYVRFAVQSHEVQSVLLDQAVNSDHRCFVIVDDLDSIVIVLGIEHLHF